MGGARIMARRGPGAPPPEPPGLSGPEVVLLGLAALWLVAGLVWALTAGGGAGTLLVALVPPALVALAVVLTRAVRLLRAEGARLAWTVAMLEAQLARVQATVEARASVVPEPEPEVAPVPEPEPRPAPAVAPAPPVAPEEEPELALPAPAAEIEVARGDLVRALQFPEDEEDSEGFAALRRALGNREVRQLIQAAQDVLTLLSQDGIYMDDLIPDQARPEVWRRFAEGERGRTVAQLGGVRERGPLGLVMRRMREDTIFRDTAHHFLRLFDRILSEFEPDAEDEELVALSGTRTARAFMLIGRAAGVFG